MEKDVRLHRYGLLTREWAKLGHHVTWWTSSFSHSPRAHVRHHDVEEIVSGVKIRVIHGPGYQRSVGIRRLIHQADFARKFGARARAESEIPDLIITPIPTLEAAKRAVEFGLEQHVPVLVDIRDEWPEEFVDLAPKVLQPFARVLLMKQFRDIKFICSNATGIIGSGEKHLTYGLKYARRPKGRNDTVLPFGYENNAGKDLQKVESMKTWWISQGVNPDAFICCFFGTIGRFFQLDTVVEAARRLRSAGTFQFVLCGAGSDLDRIRLVARGVDTVFLPGWVDEPRIAALMEMSKVGLCAYKAGARMALPNKPIEYMAGGLALVSSLRGELEQLLERHNNGVTYHADSAEELVKILRDLYHNPKACREMRERSRRTFEVYFDISTVARRMVEHMESVSVSGAQRPDFRVPIFPTNFGTSDNCKEMMR